MTYEELLKKAYEKMPKKAEGSERLEIPELEVIKEGTQVIIKNFAQIAQAIRRDPKHIIKYLSKELAAPGSFDGKRASFQTGAMKTMIQKKLDNYIRDCVYCRECKRPDTALIKDDRITFLKCEACGAKYAIKA